MGNIINFRKARKTAERPMRQQAAAANRLKHGRTKAERNLETARQVKISHHLDQHRVDTGDER